VREIVLIFFVKSSIVRSVLDEFFCSAMTKVSLCERFHVAVYSVAMR